MDRQIAHCKSCGAEIVWGVTRNMRRIPLDAEPVAQRPGLFRFVGQQSVVENVGWLYVSHFATCPDADEHRKPR
jgi:hypothetical protein